jgi:amidase
MAVQLPTPSQLLDIADEIGLDLTDADVTSFLGLLGPNIAAYNVVDSMADNLPAVRYPRTPGYRPTGDENAYNAWYVKTTVHGAAEGKLKGKTIVLKDNIMLAGVPMMNGAATMEGYIPDIDATVVHRILDAGGKILGKAHCEYFCLSGGSHTNSTGPVHNPHKRDTRPEARPRAVPFWWPAARRTWRSAATRAAPSVCLPASAASTA